MCGRRGTPTSGYSTAPRINQLAPRTRTHTYYLLCGGPGRPGNHARAHVQKTAAVHGLRFRSGLANACTRPTGASLELWTDLYARTARVVVVVLVLRAVLYCTDLYGWSTVGLLVPGALV